MQPQTTGIAPVYLTDLDRTLGVLQQLQVLLAARGDVKLADVARLVLSMQQEFGRDASLEAVIQALVARHLERQLACRRGRTKGAEVAV